MGSRTYTRAHTHALMHTHACVAAYTCVNTTENAVAHTKPATLTNRSNKIQCKKNNNETLKKETKNTRILWKSQNNSVPKCEATAIKTIKTIQSHGRNCRSKPIKHNIVKIKLKNNNNTLKKRTKR